MSEETGGARIHITYAWEGYRSLIRPALCGERHELSRLTNSVTVASCEKCIEICLRDFRPA